MSDISHESWNVVPSCDLVLVMVNSSDTMKCVDQMGKAFGK